MDYIIDYEKLYFTKGNVEVLNYQITPVCMALFNQNEGACATVNLGTYCGNNTIMPKNCAFIDTNNGLLSSIEELEKISDCFNVKFIISISQTKDDLPSEVQSKVVVSL